MEERAQKNDVSNDDLGPKNTYFLFTFLKQSARIVKTRQQIRHSAIAVGGARRDGNPSFVSIFGGDPLFHLNGHSFGGHTQRRV